MAALEAMWSARSPRERRVIAGGLLAVAIAVLWAYVWSPLQAERARLANDLPRLRVDAATVAAGAQDAIRLRNAAQRIPTGGAEAAIQSRGRETFPAAFGGVAALGDERYGVTLQPVPFDTLARFLAGLAADHGLVVDRLALSAQSGGSVAVEALVLRAPRSP